jgi:hypothetical protein
MWRTCDGYTLRTPATGPGITRALLHRADLQGEIRRYYQGDLPQALGAVLARLIAPARYQGTIRHLPSGWRYRVFATGLGGRPYWIVTRPVAGRPDTIMAIRPLPRWAAGEGENSGAKRTQLPARRAGLHPTSRRVAAASGPRHPNVDRPADEVRREARRLFFMAYPRWIGRAVEVHHRIPLEWRRLFPQADPNRLSNLQPLRTLDHRRKASDLWDAFRAAYRRRRSAPGPGEVMQFARLVDRSLDLPYPL